MLTQKLMKILERSKIQKPAERDLNYRERRHYFILKISLYLY